MDQDFKKQSTAPVDRPAVAPAYPGVHEPGRGADLFGRSPSNENPARQPDRKHLTQAETAALVRDLRRLSEVCDQTDLDQAAALIEVAALMVETQAHVISALDEDETARDTFGLL